MESDYLHPPSPALITRSARAILSGGCELPQEDRSAPWCPDTGSARAGPVVDQDRRESSVTMGGLPEPPPPQSSLRR